VIGFIVVTTLICLGCRLREGRDHTQGCGISITVFSHPGVLLLSRKNKKKYINQFHIWHMEKASRKVSTDMYTKAWTNWFVSINHLQCAIYVNKMETPTASYISKHFYFLVGLPIVRYWKLLSNWGDVKFKACGTVWGLIALQIIS
jgi:hypothetical protein